MLNRIHGKQVYRMLLVSILLVFSLSTVVLADDSPSASDPTSDLYPLWFSLQEIYEAFKSTYWLLDDWTETFLPNIESAVTDIKSYLYYNGQSAAYYLYKIESHLATIAGNSSSSGTDLSGVLGKLDTAITNLSTAVEHLASMDANFDLLNIYQTLLYELVQAMETDVSLLGDINTKLDKLTDIDTELDYIYTMLSLISSDTYDILEKLSADGAFSTDISGVLTDLDSVLDKLGALDTHLSTTNTHLSGIGSDIGSILELLQQNGAFTTDISGVLADLGTIISNQSSVLSVLQTMSDSLETIVNRLSYSETGIGYYAYRINNFLRNDFTEKLDAVIALLQEDGAFTTDISGVLDVLESVENDTAFIEGYLNNIGDFVGQLYNYSIIATENQKSILEVLQKDGAFTTDISGVLDVLESVENDTAFIKGYLNNIADFVGQLYNYSIIATENQKSILEVLANISDALSADGLIGDELHDIGFYTQQLYIKLGAFQEQQNTLVDTISKSLNHNNFSVAYYVWALGGLVERSFESVLANQSTALPVLQSMSESFDTIIALLQQEGVFSTDLTGVLTDLGTLISNQETTLELLQQEGAFTNALSDVLWALDSSIEIQNEMFGSFAEDHSDVLADLDTLISNQETTLELLQQEGIFTTYLTGVLTDLESLIENQNTALANQQALNSTLVNIESALTYNDIAVAQRLYNLNANMISRLSDVTDNQKSILALLQQEGAFTTDLSGVLADLDDVINNQGAVLPVLQSVSETISSIDESLNYGNYGVGYRLYSMNNKFTTMIENQQKLIDLIEDLELTTNVTIENIENITIDVTNKAYEVFYITDNEGNEQNLADFSGDVLTISGRLLNFFFKVAFDDAMDSVDSALDDMTEFYIDDSVLVGGGSLWE